MMDESCETCRFSGQREGDAYLRCRRHPPVHLVDEEAGHAVCPDIEPEDWCGEYEPQKPAAKFSGQVAGVNFYGHLGVPQQVTYKLLSPFLEQVNFWREQRLRLTAITLERYEAPPVADTEEEP